MKAIHEPPGIEVMQRPLLSPHGWAKRPRQHRRKRRLARQLQADVDYSAIAFPPTAGVFYPLPLSPKIAAVSTSGRYDVVAINAPMLQRGKLADIKTPGLPGPPLAVENVTAGAPA